MSLGTVTPCVISGSSRHDTALRAFPHKLAWPTIQTLCLGAALLAVPQYAPGEAAWLKHLGGESLMVTAQQDDQPRITVTGSRITQGNAVECPQIRTDDGQVYSISYLAPSIAIGDRVAVTGFMAHVTDCLGPVLYAEKVVHKP